MQFVSRLPSILLLGVVYVAFVLAGGAVFWRLEGGLVEQNLVRLREEKSRLLQRLSCLDIQSLEEVGQVRSWRVLILGGWQKLGEKAGVILKGND